MADGEAFTIDTRPEDILAEREGLYIELEEVGRRERKVSRIYTSQLEQDLLKNRVVSTQFIESLQDEASLNTYTKSLLDTDNNTLTQYYGALGVLGGISDQKISIANRLSSIGESSEEIENKITEGDKLAKKISTQIAELKNAIQLAHTRTLDQINIRRGVIVAAEKNIPKDTTPLNTPTLEGALEDGETFEDPFKTDFDEEQAWQTTAQSSFDLEQKYVDQDVADRDASKIASAQKFENKGFITADLQSTPTSVLDSVPKDDKDDFSHATIGQAGELSLEPIDDGAVRDQKKYTSMMRFEDVDTNTELLPFNLDDVDRRPISNWREAQGKSRIVTQADIETKNKVEAATRASTKKDTQKKYQTTPNTFLPEDTELLTPDQKNLLSPNDPSQAWNEALNGVRDRELQNAKSTEELVRLLAGKYGNSTFGLGGRKKTGRELAAIIITGQNQENIEYGIQIADRELAHKAQELQQEFIQNKIDQEQEIIRQDTLNELIQQDPATNEVNSTENTDAETAKKIATIKKILKKHDLKLDGFLAAVKGETQEEKIKNLSKTSASPLHAVFGLFLSAIALCVDALELITAVPAIGTPVQYLVIVIKYTTLIPGTAIRMLHGMNATTRYIIMQKLIAALRGKIILLILSSLGEFIPVAGPFWPGTSILVRFLNHTKDEAVQITMEIARTVKKA